jgi:hypothetical protein
MSTDRLPKDVQDTIDRANDLHREMKESQEPAPIEDDGQAQPEPTQEQPQAQPENPAPKEGDPDYWKQRFLSTEGLLKQKSQKVMELETRVLDLEQILASMQSAPAVQEPSPANPASIQPVNPEAFADYGDEVQQLVRALNTVVARVEALEGTTSSVKGKQDRIETAQRQTEKERFFASLEREVPHYKEIAVAPEWHDWLQQADPLAGEKRLALFLRATDESAPDLPRVVKFYEAFQSEYPQFRQENTGGKGRLSPEVDKQVAPRSSSAAAPQGGNKTIWTKERVTQLYTDKAQGRYRGKDAEFAALEKDLQAALTEGRAR